MSAIEYNNKKIAVNTVIIYTKMILMTLIGFFTMRYVLMALGVSDYGLYNVVGGAVSVLGFISIAMMTTTTRYINVEKGKGEQGDVKKIFNVCLVLHIGFALLLYLIGLTAGFWYINNVLNVSTEKMSDARFVFFISTSIAALAIIIVPYQALMSAYERFRQIATIDIIISCLKIPFVIGLLLYTGNHLRFYAVGMCLLTLLSLLSYALYCRYQFANDVRWRFSRDKSLYKEILIFNNYTSMGAIAYIGRFQGSPLVINYFFGTIVNGAYAIAMQVENLIQNLVGNLVTAANPQMTQSYSSGDFQRSVDILCRITRFSTLIMIVLTFSLLIELNMLLELWLKNVPEGAFLFCTAILFSLFVRSLGSGVDAFIQATGKIKWYQTIQSLLLISGIPMSILFFMFGFPAVYIIYSFIICDILRTIAMFVIICRITDFDFKRYAVSVYNPIIKVLAVLVVYYLLYNFIEIDSALFRWIGLFFSVVVTIIVCFMGGLSSNERLIVLNKL